MLVAHDDAIDLVCVERLDGIDQALALDRRGGRSTEVQAVGRKALLQQARRALRVRVGVRPLNTSTMVLPLRVGTFLTGTLPFTAENAFAGPENRHDIDIGNTQWMSMRRLWLKDISATPLPAEAEPTRSPGLTSKISTAVSRVGPLQIQTYVLLMGRGHVLTNKIRRDGQLAMATINKDSQLDTERGDPSPSARQEPSGWFRPV